MQRLSHKVAVMTGSSSSEMIGPFDVAETAVYFATLGRHTVVHQIVLDRLGADW